MLHYFCHIGSEHCLTYTLKTVYTLWGVSLSHNNNHPAFASQKPPRVPCASRPCTACALSAWLSILRRKVVSAVFSRKEAEARRMAIVGQGCTQKGVNILVYTVECFFTLFGVYIIDTLPLCTRCFLVGNTVCEGASCIWQECARFTVLTRWSKCISDVYCCFSDVAKVKRQTKMEASFSWFLRFF